LDGLRLAAAHCRLGARRDFDEANNAVWAKDVHDSGKKRLIALTNGGGPLCSWLGAVVTRLGAAPLTPADLRAGLGSTDDEFDPFVRANPAVGARHHGAVAGGV
jgi:hypothetical protein